MAGNRGLNWRPTDIFVPEVEMYGTPGPLRLAGLPPASGDIDRISQVDGFFMWGNGPDDKIAPGFQGCGNCVWIELLNAIRAMTTLAGVPAEFPYTYAVELYSKYMGYKLGDASTDRGTDMTVALNAWKNDGFTDTTGKVHKIAMWAAMRDPQNEALAVRILNVFGCVIDAYELQDTTEIQFDNNAVWQWMTNGVPIGGHGVPLLRRAGSGTGVLHVPTWARNQQLTRKFRYNAIRESYAVATVDFVKANGDNIIGIDFAQMLADMKYV